MAPDEGLEDRPHDSLRPFVLGRHPWAEVHPVEHEGAKRQHRLTDLIALDYPPRPLGGLDEIVDERVDALRASRAQKLDLGAALASTPATVTIALKLRNPDQVQQQLQSVYTQGSPVYHHFMTTGEFAQAYGPDAATVAQVTRRFQAQGLTVTRVSTTMLQVSGTTGQIQSAFGTQGLAPSLVAAGITNSLGLTRGSGVTTNSSGNAAANAWGFAKGGRAGAGAPSG